MNVISKGGALGDFADVALKCIMESVVVIRVLFEETRASVAVDTAPVD